jgi:hypothetical protein
MKKIPIVFLFFISISLYSQEYVVVSSSSLGKLSHSQIRVLFLKKSMYVKDLKIVPLNLGINDATRKSFEKHVLKMSFLHLKTYWTKQHYLGKRPPINVKSARSMNAYLRKVHGSIGYMKVDDSHDKLNTLYKWSD